MHVYLLPIGPRTWELYCETPAAPPAEDVPSGFLQRQAHRGRIWLDELEREPRRPLDLTPEETAARPPRGWRTRVADQVRRWIAESVAEQRLLWRLRGQPAVTAHVPDDLSAEEAGQVIEQHLRRDRNRHLWGFVVNTLLFVVSGLLTPLPGPNVVAYYFAFRLTGHFFSFRGARHGLGAAMWTYESSAALSAVRALPDGVDERRLAAEEIERALGLVRLSEFLERVAGGCGPTAPV